MIKSKLVFAVSFVALFACGVVRADIASVQYVDNNKLTAGENVTIDTDGAINVPTLDESWYYYEDTESYKTKPVSGDAFMRALKLVLPSNYVNSDDWTFWNEMDFGADWYYGDGRSLSDIVKDLAYEKVYPLTNQVSDLSDRIMSKQNEISTSYGTDCYEEEGEWYCDNEEDINNGLVSINGDGEVVGARLLDAGKGEFITGVTVEDDGTVTISRGDIDISGVRHRFDGTDYKPGFVITGFEGSLESVDLSVNDSPVEISYNDAEMRLDLDIDLPVADDMEKGVVYLANDENYMSDPYSTAPTVEYMNEKLQLKEDVANKVSKKSDAYAQMGQTEKDAYDARYYASLKYVDTKVDDAVSTIDTSMADLNAKVGQNSANIETLSTSLADAEDLIDTKQDKLTAGAGINIAADAANSNALTISANSATAAEAGIAKLGTIPAGADKKGTATIWIE